MQSYSISLIATVVALGSCLAASALATDGPPVIVVPGKLGVPVIINGVDATGAVVYGEFGLSRPGHGNLIIEGGTPARREPWHGSYFPATGQPPTYGRMEAPSKPRPRASTDFHQSWSAGSDDTPATEPPAYDPPAVIVAPRDRRERSKVPLQLPPAP